MVLHIGADGATTITTRDPQGSPDFRVLTKHGLPFALDMAEFAVGRPFVVFYRRLWPWGIESLLHRLARVRNPRVARSASARLARRHTRLGARERWERGSNWTGILR